MLVCGAIFLLIYVGCCQGQNASSGVASHANQPPSLGTGNVLVHGIKPVAPEVPKGVQDTTPGTVAASTANLNLPDSVLHGDLLAKLGINPGSSLDYTTDNLMPMFDTGVQKSQKNMIGILSDSGLSNIGTIGGHQTTGPNDYILLGGHQNDVMLNNQAGADALSNHLYSDHPHILASDLPSLAANLNQNPSNMHISDSHLLSQGGVIGLIDAGSSGNTLQNDQYTLNQMTDTGGLININDAYGLVQDPATGGLVSLQGGMLQNHGLLDIGGGLGTFGGNETFDINGNILNGAGQDPLNVINLNGNQLTDLNGLIGINDVNGAGAFDIVRLSDGSTVNLNTGVRQLNNDHQLLFDLGANYGSVNSLGSNDALLLNNPGTSGDFILNDPYQSLSTSQLIELNNAQNQGALDIVSINNGLSINQGLGDIVGLSDAVLYDRGVNGQMNVLNGFNGVTDSRNIIGLFDRQGTGQLNMIDAKQLPIDTQNIVMSNSGTNGDTVQAINAYVNDVQASGNTTGQFPDVKSKSISASKNGSSKVGKEPSMTNPSNVAPVVNGSTQGGQSAQETTTVIYGTTKDKTQITNAAVPTSSLPPTYVRNNMNTLTQLNHHYQIRQSNIIPTATSDVFHKDTATLNHADLNNLSPLNLASPSAGTHADQNSVNLNTSVVEFVPGQQKNNLRLISINELLGLGNNGNSLVTDNGGNILAINQNHGQSLPDLMGLNGLNIVTSAPSQAPQHSTTFTPQVNNSKGQALTDTSSKIAGVQFMANTGKNKPRSTKAKQTTNIHDIQTTNANNVRNTLVQQTKVMIPKHVIAGTLNNAPNGLSQSMQSKVTSDPTYNTANSIPQTIQRKAMKNPSRLMTTLNDVHPSNSVMLSEVHQAGPVLHIAPGSPSLLTIGDLKNAALEKLTHNVTSIDSTNVQTQPLDRLVAANQMQNNVFPGTMSTNQVGNNITPTVPEAQIPTNMLSAGVDQTQPATFPFVQNETIDRGVYYWDANQTDVVDYSQGSGMVIETPFMEQKYGNIPQQQSIRVPTISHTAAGELLNTVRIVHPPEATHTITSEQVIEIIPPIDTTTSKNTRDVLVSPKSQLNRGNARQETMTVPPVQRHTVQPTISVTGPILIENTSKGLTFNKLVKGKTLDIRNRDNVKVPRQVLASRKTKFQTRGSKARVDMAVQTTFSPLVRNVMVNDVMSHASGMQVKPTVGIQHSSTKTIATTDTMPFDVNNNIIMTTSTLYAPTTFTQNQVPSVQYNAFGNPSKGVGIPSTKTLTNTNNQRIAGTTFTESQSPFSTSQTVAEQVNSSGDVKSTGNGAIKNVIGPKTIGSLDVPILPNTEVILGEGIDFGGRNGGGEMFIIGNGFSLVNDVNKDGTNITSSLDLTGVKDGIPTSSNSVNDLSNTHRLNQPTVIGSSSSHVLSALLQAGHDIHNTSDIATTFTGSPVMSSRTSDIHAATSAVNTGSVFDIIRSQTYPNNNQAQLQENVLHINSNVPDTVHGSSMTSLHSLQGTTSTTPSMTNSPIHLTGSAAPIEQDPAAREIGNRNIVNRFTGTESDIANSRRSFILSRLTDPNFNNNEFILIQNVKLPKNGSSNSTIQTNSLTTMNLTDNSQLQVGEIQSNPISITDRFGMNNGVDTSRDFINTLDPLPLDQNSLKMPLSPARRKSIEQAAGSDQVILRLKSLGLGDLFGANDFITSNDSSSRNQTPTSSTIDVSAHNNPTSGDVFTPNDALSMNDGLNTPIGVVTADIRPRMITVNSPRDQTNIISKNVSKPISTSDGFVQPIPLKPRTRESTNPGATSGRLVDRRFILPPTSGSTSISTTDSRGTVGTTGDGGRLLELPRRGEARRPVLAFFQRRGSTSPRRSLILLRGPQATSSTSSESSDRLQTPSTSRRTLDGRRRIRFRGTPLLDRLAQRPRGDASRYLVPPRLIRPTSGSVSPRIRRLLRLPNRGRLSRSRRPPRITTLRRQRGRALLENELSSRDILGTSSSSSLGAVSSVRSLRDGTGSIFADMSPSIRSLSSRISPRSRSIRSIRTPPARPPIVRPAEISPPPFSSF